MAAPRSTYTINYFPAQNAGYTMWSSYNGAQCSADMALAAADGFNTIRMFCQALPGIFDFPTPTQGELANLVDFYNRAKTLGVKLHLTLFDLWQAFGHVADSKTHVQAILGALPDLTAIQSVELKNEVRYSSTGIYSATAPNQGFDAGYPGTPPNPATVGQVATVWAQQMIPWVRSTFNVPTVISCGNGTADFSAIVPVLQNTAQAPDWFEFHLYPPEPRAAYAYLQTVKGIMADPTMLFIGETGITSTPSQAVGQLPTGPTWQADFLQHVRWSCQQLGVPEPAPWTLFDFAPSAQFTGGQTLGLYDVNAAPKFAGRLLEKYPPGSTVPPVKINSSMSGEWQDAQGNRLPLGWMLYHGQTGLQPISATVSTVGNVRSVILTGSSQLITDNAPGLEADPRYPVITPSQTYTFSIDLAASGSYGQPNLTISWYDLNNNFLSSTNGSPLTLGATYGSRFSLQSQAPGSAAFARLSVKTPHNAGQIFATGAQWG